MIHYFAYGSNLHPVRLIERVPSARLVCAAELAQHKLSFHKKSRDGSSKCNLYKTESDPDIVHGAIYEIDPRHKESLDKFEGNGFGYFDSPILIKNKGIEYNCFTYLARCSHIADNVIPYHWYKQLVVLGARYLQFPDIYISSIEANESMQDPDEGRKIENAKLIERVINYR